MRVGVSHIINSFDHAVTSSEISSIEIFSLRVEAFSFIFGAMIGGSVFIAQVENSNQAQLQSNFTQREGVFFATEMILPEVATSGGSVAQVVERLRDSSVSSRISLGFQAEYFLISTSHSMTTVLVH